MTHQHSVVLSEHAVDQIRGDPILHVKESGANQVRTRNGETNGAAASAARAVSHKTKSDRSRKGTPPVKGRVVHIGQPDERYFHPREQLTASLQTSPCLTVIDPRNPARDWALGVPQRSTISRPEHAPGQCCWSFTSSMFSRLAKQLGFESGWISRNSRQTAAARQF